jgi:hypothetical protein
LLAKNSTPTGPTEARKKIHSKNTNKKGQHRSATLFDLFGISVFA